LVITFLLASIITINQSNLAMAVEPSKLKISAGPTSVPADNNVYECIFVELQDSSSKPARATQDTIISLSSSVIAVGDVDRTITIGKGSTFAVAKFHSTFTPGTTAIAATASGYVTVQTSLVTVAPVPSKLALYGFPSILPSDGTPYEALVVQLQDASGTPAKAPLDGIQVTLSSSNSTRAAVPDTITISGGQTYALARVTSNAPDSATITALASGYSSTQTTLTPQQPTSAQPKSLRLCIAPQKTSADNTEHPLIVVQVLDAAQKITQLSSANITVLLASSEENVGTVQPTLAIQTGKSYATAKFAATYKAGTTTITAAATDLTADTETLTTIGPIPSKLAVFCTPSLLPADTRSYDTIQVQLQDAQGKPAKDPDGDVTVSLFSSDPTIGTVATTLTIPYGETYATATFTTTHVASSTTITAQASGYTTGQAKMTTYAVEQAPPNISAIQLCIKDDTGPVSDALVSTLSQPTGMTKLTGTTNSTGYVVFPNAIEGTYAINITKQGYSPMNITLNFKTTSSVLTLFLTKTATDSLPGQDLTIVWLVLIAVIIVVIVVVAAYLQKRKTTKRFQVPQKWSPPPPPKPRK